MHVVVYECGTGISVGVNSAKSRFVIAENIVVKCAVGLGGWAPKEGMAEFTLAGNDFFANGADFADPFDRERDFPTLLTGSLFIDPLFINPDDPAGADRRFGTADDGLALRPESQLRKTTTGH